MSDQEKFDAQQSEPPRDKPAGRLISLASSERAQPDHLLLEMREYWQSLRQGRSVPARSDVAPQGIRRILDYSFILERIAPGAARFRLAGQHLIDLMGMEVRGMPMCSVISAPSRGRFSDVLETVFKAPQIAEFWLYAPADYARPELSARLLLLPLKSDLGDVNRALGCLVTRGDLGAAPRRFDITDDRVSPVFDGAVAMQPSPSAAGFAEPPRARFRPAEPGTPKPQAPDTPEARRASFRVISGSDS
ncbi:PAS domain-containing protein [Paracoccus homiensis]|uniref:PAS domain-containing protein n=1 Tax=Paracoccus homiensis TaxID=364199 RepID=A0A1I0CNE2_9RHOB|nr:PAS domain-containing protein [Paracoccus homiensis]SET20530.1 hypothetical protein SAMN04489858_103370 [Paracoccus homiensis]